MTKGFARALLLGGLVAPGTLVAQGPIASRVQVDTKLVQPECQLDGGDFRVSSGKTYLKTGIEGSGDPSNKISALKSGVRVVTEAITTAGQGKSSAAWYWLGRLYMQQGDLAGADTAFTHALALAPGCKDDIKQYRYRAWGALVNAGINFRKAQQNDSAFIMFRAANEISRQAPLALVNMAEMFDAATQTDSAIYYFRLASETAPTDSDEVKVRNQAMFNYGALLLNAGRGPEAVVAFHRYLTMAPSDVTAQKGLARAYRAAGMADSAEALERKLVSQPGVGEAAGAGEGLSEDDLMSIGAKQFESKNYHDAVTTFARVVAANPWNRNAVYDLGNAYLALQDGPNVVTTADQLIAIEPLSEFAYTLKAQGYRLLANQDAQIKAFVAREALPVNLDIASLKVTADGATLTGKLTGREARDAKGNLLPPKAVTVTVEFLSKDATVVASADVDIPVLKAGESTPFTADAKGAGIQLWRYRVK